MTTIIHFVSEVTLPPINEEGPPTPQWRIVCMPNMTDFGETAYHPPYRRSDDTRAVTCMSCRKSQLFIDAQRRLNDAAKK